MTEELEGPSLDSDDRVSSSSSEAGSGPLQIEEDKKSKGFSRLTESEGSTNRVCDEREEAKHVFARGFDM